jgi:hypothetical protein
VNPTCLRKFNPTAIFFKKWDLFFPTRSTVLTIVHPETANLKKLYNNNYQRLSRQASVLQDDSNHSCKNGKLWLNFSNAGAPVLWFVHSGPDGSDLGELFAGHGQQIG